jgi:hypothetical protein
MYLGKRTFLPIHKALPVFIIIYLIDTSASSTNKYQTEAYIQLSQALPNNALKHLFLPDCDSSACRPLTDPIFMTKNWIYFPPIMSFVENSQANVCMRTI